MKQLVLHLSEKVNMRNITLTIFTFSIIFHSGLSIFAQQTNKKCYAGVDGQSAVIPCPSQQPTNSCIQNPKFTTLNPVSPSQLFKDYENEHNSTPQTSETSADSPDCSITSSGKQKFCLRTYTTHQARMSSIYVTNTMEAVRGFWNVSYRIGTPEDNMGTLLAKGTVIYDGFMKLNDGTLFPNTGGTYLVDRREFDCIQPVSEADKAETANQIKDETRLGLYNYFKFENGLFVRRIN